MVQIDPLRLAGATDDRPALPLFPWIFRITPGRDWRGNCCEQR